MPDRLSTGLRKAEGTPIDTPHPRSNMTKLLHLSCDDFTQRSLERCVKLGPKIYKSGSISMIPDALVAGQNILRDLDRARAEKLFAGFSFVPADKADKSSVSQTTTRTSVFINGLCYHTMALWAVNYGMDVKRRDMFSLGLTALHALPDQALEEELRKASYELGAAKAGDAAGASVPPDPVIAE